MIPIRARAGVLILAVSLAACKTGDGAAAVTHHTPEVMRGRLIRVDVTPATKVACRAVS